MPIRLVNMLERYWNHIQIKQREMDIIVIKEICTEVEHIIKEEINIYKLLYWGVKYVAPWRAYLIEVHRRDAYKDKKKTVSDVKYIYLFFKVDKCSNLGSYAWWTSGNDRCSSRWTCCQLAGLRSGAAVRCRSG